MFFCLATANGHEAPSLGSQDLGRKGFTLRLESPPASSTPPPQAGLCPPLCVLFHSAGDPLLSSSSPLCAIPLCWGPAFIFQDSPVGQTSRRENVFSRLEGWSQGGYSGFRLHHPENLPGCVGFLRLGLFCKSMLSVEMHKEKGMAQNSPKMLCS